MYRLSANGMRAGGAPGFGGACVLGDAGSDKSTQQNTSIANHQVTQSGEGQIGISGSTLNQSSVTVIDGDAQTAQGALALANNSVAHASALVAQTLKNFDDQQNRMNETVQEAVEAAQATAYKSTEIPEGALSQDVTRQVLTAGVVGLGIVAAAILLKKK